MALMRPSNSAPSASLTAKLLPNSSLLRSKCWKPPCSAPPQFPKVASQRYKPSHDSTISSASSALVSVASRCPSISIDGRAPVTGEFEPSGIVGKSSRIRASVRPCTQRVNLERAKRRPKVDRLDLLCSHAFGRRHPVAGRALLRRLLDRFEFVDDD